MANTSYDPGEQRAAKVHELFSRIAPRYDLINDLQSFGLHRYWKRRVIQEARPQSEQRALDLCCGTGDLALGLARHAVRVTGLDFSQRMLEQAAQRASSPRFQNDAGFSEPKRQRTAALQDAGALSNPPKNAKRLGVRLSSAAVESPRRALASPNFICGDAQRIPFADNTFDIVTVGYGLRNLASWEAGLREMQRVAKPGGWLVVLDFGKPDNTLWRALYFAYLKLFVPCLGRIFCGDASAYAYILESLKHYPAQHGVGAKMRELGLHEVRVVSLLGGVMSINFGEKRSDGVME